MKSNPYHWIIENMSLIGREFKLLFHPIQPKPCGKVGIRGNLVLPILKKAPKANGQLVNSHIRIMTRLKRDQKPEKRHIHVCLSHSEKVSLNKNNL